MQLAQSVYKVTERSNWSNPTLQRPGRKQVGTRHAILLHTMYILPCTYYSILYYTANIYQHTRTGVQYTAQELVPCTYPQLSSGKWQRRSINLSVVLMMTMAMAKLAHQRQGAAAGSGRTTLCQCHCSVVHTATKSSVPVPHSLPTTTSSLQHHTFSQQLWSLAQMRKQMLVPDLYVIHSNCQPIKKGKKKKKKEKNLGVGGIFFLHVLSFFYRLKI